jgi:hypothetical protein
MSNHLSFGLSEQTCRLRPLEGLDVNICLYKFFTIQVYSNRNNNVAVWSCVIVFVCSWSCHGRMYTVWDRLFPIRKKNVLSTGPETTRKRSVCSRASKCYNITSAILNFWQSYGHLKIASLYGGCINPVCIGKSNTNNLPAPTTDLIENPYEKKNIFTDPTQKLARVVVSGIVI